MRHRGLADELTWRERPECSGADLRYYLGIQSRAPWSSAQASLASAELTDTGNVVKARISQKVAVSVVFVAAMFMSIMDATIVNVALPTIGRDFAVSPTAVDSISISFLVSLAVFIPASGWLGDRFGGKRVLLAAIVVFTVASAMCGLATSLGELVIFRVLQGVGGGMLAPVGMAMLFRVFPPEERIRASAILTVPTTLAPALGPVLGGLLVTDLSWRWVFYVNVPIGAAALLFGLLFLRTVPQSEPGKFDLPGFLLAGFGLGLAMYGVSEGPVKGWHSADVLGTIAAGVVLLAAMVVVELRHSAPLVDLRLLANRLFRSSNGVMVLAIGLVGVAASIALLALLGPTTSLWWARLLMFALGLSMGQVFVPVQAAAFATITPAATGRASTMFNAVRQLGGAVGVAVLTTAIVLVGPIHLVAGHPAANLTAYRVAFLVAAAVALLAVPCALSIRDSDAARTIPVRRVARHARGSAVPAHSPAPAPVTAMESPSLESPSRAAPSLLD
jgi:MFS family permease